MLKYKRNIQTIKNLYYAASYGDGYFLNGQITALGASGQTELLWDCLFLVFFFFSFSVNSAFLNGSLLESLGALV